MADETHRCDNCRRLKERCTGGVPCDGCIKAKRECAFTSAYRRTRRRPEVQKLADAINPKAFFDIDRIRNLEKIVKHFTDIQDFSPTKLAETVTLLSAGSPPPWDRANLQFDEGHDDDPSNQATRDTTSMLASVATAEQLLSFPFVVQEAVSLFPPAEVATTLLDIFFNVAQTNYFYVDEDVIRTRISQIYAHPATPLTIADAPWVCTALMVFCVSTQFAHLVKGRQSNTGEVDVTSAIDDTLALSFYRKATAMIPDLLTIGSAQCVQAFILMGVYTLPVDPAGLASSYYGMAMKIAIHNNMHLKSKSKTRDAEMRNRIWWTVYTLERRVSILHGRPASIQRSQISTALPVNRPELQPSGRPNTFHNAMAQKDLTEIMEDARDNILMIKKATPSSSILQGLHGWVKARNTLIKRCIESAITSVQLCQKLHDEFGLSKSSYTEFTSCCAAVVTLIAQRILSKTVEFAEFGDICDQGMTLLKIMSGGVFANTKSSEKRGLEILEMTLAKLGASHGESPSLGGAGYDQFRTWVSLQVEPERLLGQEQAVPTMEWAYGSSPEQGSFHSEMNLMPEFVPTNFAELASLPGLENYFQSSIG
ncbi:uncharacterized protein NECHADRAFT_37244 [Fusarium vanettenii 77-13-4]|uniref:Zn(2)-C6 fungal-type domain-containing protein n=1 Tax=Fusarium vanettenii (strain ATCC MYA-4622 / CBS 123669 / FGSC 9596 / NRRL 45880 / 77-13-4) TaxID=660122 RepID=C7ZFB3_FUSV7|nr:uncharacterized protein NECHADRAFT_37244 [Fusarium vanettenii 77-13-4]EEU37191.1 hypothetical protein NECHADRAFT_37244 [Fusarium vanettenii 77-13-4]